MTYAEFLKLIRKGWSVPNWDSDSFFNTNDYVFGSNGKLYLALSDSQDKNPVELGNEAFWKEIIQTFEII